MADLLTRVANSLAFFPLSDQLTQEVKNFVVSNNTNP